MTKCHKDAQSIIDLHRFYSQEEVRREMEDIASPMHRDGAWRVPLWTVPTNSPVENRFHVPKGTFFTRHAGTKHLERPLEDLKDDGLLTDGLRDTPRYVSLCVMVVCWSLRTPLIYTVCYAVCFRLFVAHAAIRLVLSYRLLPISPIPKH